MTFQFGEFELSLERYELRRNGVVLHVEPLVFDLISVLAANPGRVVTREEIVERVWQGRAVSEATIDGCVKSARRVLGDTRGVKALIRTVRGRGFEFATTVKEEKSEVSRGAESLRRETSQPVVAVFPLANHSSSGDDYFADGLTEDIITCLSRFRDLRVIAASSTLQFRDRGLGIPNFCEELHAGYAVQGTVRRSEGRIRIAVQLLDGATAVQLWGERYDRELGDVFSVQDELTRTIAATLGARVQDVALRKAMTRHPHELDSWDCLLRARRYTSTLSPEVHAEARDLLEKAVLLDPHSAEAHALLANVYLGEHRFGMNPRPDPIGRAFAHARLATELDPQNAYARCWLAIVHFFRKENETFEAEAALALKLNPNDPEILADIGHYLAFMGEFERGVALSRKAQELNPLHPGWYYFSFARHDYNRKAYAKVIAGVERMGLPHFYWAHILDAAAKGQLERADAREALDRMKSIKPGISARRELETWNAAPHDLDHILDGLRKAGWRE